MPEHLPVDLALVSTRLKALRARVALYQHEVAGAVGIPPRTYQSIENGEVQSAEANYAKLATYYSKQLGEEITVHHLLHGEQDFAEQELRRLASALRKEMRAEMDERLSALREEMLSHFSSRHEYAA